MYPGAMRPVRLYDSTIPSGNAYKVSLMLSHLGIAVPVTELDILASPPETRRPEYLARNSNGRIPLLELSDGSYLAESNAILYFLATGVAGGARYLPDDALGRARALQWMFFEQYEHEPAIAVARFLKTYSGKPELWEAQREHLTKRGIKALRALEGGLEGRDWLAGDAMTIADIALYAYTHSAEEGGFSLDEYPAIRAWLERVASQPGHVTIDV